MYVDHRLNDDRPFYVGKGTWKRVLNLRRNELHDRIMAKHGMYREVVLETRDNAVACHVEIELISHHRTRREDGGANLTGGGEGNLGWCPSQATRIRMGEKKRGKKLDDDHRKSMSAAHRSRYESQGARDATAEQQRATWADDGYRARMRASRRGSGNGRAVLTEAKVIEIREAFKRSEPASSHEVRRFCAEQSRLHCVTSITIHNIVVHRTWQHLPA